MSNGGYKGSTPARETSPEQYPGVWELTEQFQAQSDGNWPFQADDCAPKSLRFNSADSAYLSKTPVAAGNRKTWTWSGWVKRSKDSSAAKNDFFGVGGNGFMLGFDNGSTDVLRIEDNFYTGGLTAKTVAVFRDYSAWYHIVLSIDTTQASSANGIRLWVNNELQTLTSVAYTQNYATLINSTTVQFVGGNSAWSNRDFNGYLADIHFIDGQALAPTDFGFYDGQGIWQPKRFTGDYSSGPVYSNSTDSGLTHAQGSAGMFDGSLTTRGGAPSTNQAYVTLFDNVSIPCSTGIRIYWNGVGSGQRYLRINGTTVLDDGSNQLTPGWSIASSFSGTINKLEVQNGSSGSWSLSAIEINGTILTDASVGRNSFHLDFSDKTKDQSGLANDWTATNLYFSGTTVAESRIWESGNTDWSIASGGANTTKTSNGSYADVFTGKFEVGKLYAFTSTFPTGDTNGGWFFADSNSTSLSGTHPNEGRGSNSIGIRGSNSTLGVHGTFATANGVSAGNSAISGFGNSDPYNGVTLNWVVDRVNHKVWVKTASGSSWIKGGNPTDPTSTASFLIPSSGDIYFGVIQYSGITNLNLASYSLSQTITNGDNSVDSPVNGNEASTGAGGERRGNYATLNPLDKRSNVSLSNGNLDVTTTSSHWSGVKGTLGVNSGKYYFEATANGSNANYMFFGICASDVLIDPSSYVQDNATERAKGMLIFCDDGRYQLDTNGRTTYSSSASNGDVISVAFDLDGNTVQFYKNGTGLGTIDISSSPLASTTVVPFFVHYNTSTTYQFNFGQRAFKHPVSGYSPLSTSFLPEPTIKRGDDAFDITLFNNSARTSGSFATTITPDLIITKRRNSSSNWILQDIVRGYGDNKNLHPNLNVGETSTNNIMGVTDKTVSFGTNDNMWDSQVAWYFDAGGATTTIAAGGLNSSAYNFDQTWSNYVTISEGNTGSNYNTNAANLFDGNTSTSTSLFSGNMVAPYSPTTVVFTPPSAITVSTGLRVYMAVNRGQKILVNGTETNSSVSAGWNTVSFTGSLTSLTIGPANAGSSSNIAAIEINQEILVNSGVTPSVNVPSIPSTVRARPETGFSIVDYTVGSNTTQTISHQLGKAPEMIFVKERNQANNWHVYHSGLGSDEYLTLNSNNASNPNNLWDDTDPTSSVFTVRSGGSSNFYDGKNQIAYCWTSIEGFSSIGSFQNPSGDGAFVFCGFKPKLIIAKCVKNISSSSGSGDWMIYDTSRLPFNNPADNNHLVVNVTNAEDGYYSSGQAAIDILSNGFKIRHQGSAPLGDPGRLYIYAAWAEVPFASQARAR